MSNKPALIPVKIAQWGQANLMYLPLYAGLYGGFAEKEGLAPTLIFAGNDDDVFNHVVTRKADFGFADPIFVEIGKLTGKKTVCIALAVKRAALWGITHNPAIPVLKKVEDFVQLRIGSFPKPSTTYSLIDGLKKKHKRLLKYTQIIEAPIGAQANLLTDNKADVIMEIEPMVSLAESRGMRAVFSLPQFYADSAITGLFTREETLQKHPLLVEKMNRILQQGLKMCLRNPSTTLKVAMHVFPDYPKEVLQKALRRLRDDEIWPQNTDVDTVLWQRAITQRQQIGDLPKRTR
jgi:NitT/TauT family transport system substrate-binding protein